MITAAALIAAAPAASAFETAGEFYRECPPELDLCTAFLAGMARGARAQAILSNDQRFCPPENSNGFQVAAVFNKYVKEHPEFEHLPIEIILIKSLSDAFPCRD